MATCKDCLHWNACKAMLEAAGGIRIADDFKGSADRCKNFVSAASVAPRAEWISVEERLPEQYGLFLIADDKGNMDAATWTKQFGWFSGSNRVKRVTHWMPLPEPPSRRAAERRLI